jgi:hypothetical protein
VSGLLGTEYGWCLNHAYRLVSVIAPGGLTAALDVNTRFSNLLLKDSVMARVLYNSFKGVYIPCSIIGSNTTASRHIRKRHIQDMSVIIHTKLLPLK